MGSWNNIPDLPAGHAVTADELEIITDYLRFEPQQLPVAYKAADQLAPVSSTVMQNDVALLATLVANAVFTHDLYVPYRTDPAADLKIGWTLPAGATSVASVEYWDTATAQQRGQITSTPTAGFAVGGFGADLFARFKGTIFTGATPGTMQIVWAANAVHASQAIVRTGATLAITRIA